MALNRVPKHFILAEKTLGWAIPKT